MRQSLIAFVVTAAFAGASVVAAADRTAIDILPQTTILYAEIPNPAGVLSTILDHPLRQKIEALESYKAATKTGDYQNFLAGRTFLETMLGMKWREALETLTARGMYVGFDSKTQGLVLLIHAKDAASLDMLRTKLLELTRLGKDPDQVKEAEYRGVTAYEVNKAKFAVIDDWLLITNKSETGKLLLDRFIDGAEQSLANSETFMKARASRAKDSAGWAYADLNTLRDAGVAKKLFAGKSENPAAELLIGGILCTLQKTPFATAQLATSNDGIELELAIPHQPDWVTEERVYYFGHDGGGRGPSLPQIKDTLFALSTYRDVSEMWLRAGDLFDEKINDGFAEADANLTTFFTGKDFGEDILGALTPQIGFVASRQDFSTVLPVPAIKLPQFALVLEMKDPTSMTRELRRTFQSLIGFLNVIGAMEGRPQLELDMDKLPGGSELVTSTYIPEPEDEESTSANILFNFSPSVGFANERFVVASTDRLARELVTAQPAVRDANAVNTSARLTADVLKDVLDDNKEQLISQNMLQDGNSREEAEGVIQLLLEFVGYFEDSSLKLTTGNNTLAAKLALRIKQF